MWPGDYISMHIYKGDLQKIEEDLAYFKADLRFIYT
jgi:hypothetical protein